jgi:PAS domain S-box-containing protein
MDAPLPRNAILEIDRLAVTFDEMRNRLTIRTAEREQAEVELLKAKEELESIVAARTVELLATNSQLRMELNERTRIESERERLRMVAEQRAAELESFISSCADGVALIDHQRQLIWLNEACHSILASCPDEIIRQWGLKYPSVEPDDDNFAVEDAPCWRALQGETLRDVRSFIVSPDGNDACISVSASPVCNSNNQIIGATIIFRDISDQIALEKQRQTLMRKSTAWHELFRKHLFLQSLLLKEITKLPRSMYLYSLRMESGATSMTFSEPLIIRSVF